MNNRDILLRIKSNAETALHATKSARTAKDVPRYIQQVIDGLTVELSLMPHDANAGVDVGKLVERFLAWPIPRTVVCDPCMTDPNYKFARSGTCIMGPRDAEIMFQHCLFPIQPPK